MHTCRRVLLGGLLVGSTAVAFAASSAAAPPGTGYAWAQPGCEAVTVPCAQPPASIPTTAALVSAQPGSDYAWAQPGTAVVSVPFTQPPAWVPTT